MSEQLPPVSPDDLKALRERLLDNLHRLDQLAFSKDLDKAKEGADLHDIRLNLESTSHLLDELGKSR
ncbi:MAG: hypothetical protein C0424_07995 [Sphingobacteriaceae bacterium]|nr:hypothetical protein [Sphingobacteriaceae bacterium]